MEGRPRALSRLWGWLTGCAVAGCDQRPAHLGWCDLHAPEYAPPPDEFWGDDGWGDAERDPR